MKIRNVFESVLTDKFEIKSGVKHGCALAILCWNFLLCCSRPCIPEDSKHDIIDEVFLLNLTDRRLFNLTSLRAKTRAQRVFSR